jgi:hypothetical protein
MHLKGMSLFECTQLLREQQRRFPQVDLLFSQVPDAANANPKPSFSSTILLVHSHGLYLSFDSVYQRLYSIVIKPIDGTGDLFAYRNKPIATGWSLLDIYRSFGA